MQYRAREFARERALESVRRRRMEAVYAQQMAVSARPGSAIMYISKSLDPSDQLRRWYFQCLLPLLSATNIDIVEFL